MELYGTEEEDISSCGLTCGLFMGFVDNKKNTEYHQTFFSSCCTGATAVLSLCLFDRHICCTESCMMYFKAPEKGSKLTF